MEVLKITTKTQLVRAPRKLVKEWRQEFPGMRDAEIINLAFNSSLMKAECLAREFFRNNNKKKKA